jgi:hypothetical protein
MTELRIYRCDVCGIEKKESNHWWRVRAGNALHIYHWNYFGEGGDDDSVPTKHICGSECLHKIVQNFIDVPFGSGSTIPTDTEVKSHETTTTTATANTDGGIGVIALYHHILDGLH